MAMRFFSRLPFLLRQGLTLTEAERTIASRLKGREERFLAILRQSIFAHPDSPYQALFRAAGCEYEDVERLVHGQGLESTLQTLFRNGVFVTVDEFKGRRDAKRGTTTIEMGSDLFQNPCSAYHVPVSTGGSRSSGTPVFMDLAFIRGCAVNSMLYLHSWGGDNWRKATWEAPGAGARFRLIKYGCFGQPPVRWFSQLDPWAPTLSPIFRWNTWAMILSSRLAGVPLPGPIHAPVNDPGPVIEWIQSALTEGASPHIFTFPSSAVAACKAAVERGKLLEGARFTLAGEPITVSRLENIRRSGAEALPRYGSMECGPIGYGCMSSVEPDEVHLLEDLHVLIHAGPDGETWGIPPKTLLITALHPRSPFVLLNASMGDQGELGRRSCGCPLELLGWSTHLWAIRSYEKLTSGGITFLGTDVIHLLEEVLPSRFGGAPTDYQLIEEETPEGHPMIKLLVNPSVGPLNPVHVRDFFLGALGTDSPINQLMAEIWRESELLTVDLRPLQQTQSGKVLHFHVSRKH